MPYVAGRDKSPCAFRTEFPGAIELAGAARSSYLIFYDRDFA